MKSIAFILLAAPVILLQTSHAQDPLPQARMDVKTLSSQAMHGRGYVLDGLTRAGEYIEKRFRRIGLQPIHGTYEQTFAVKVNTFALPPRLSVDREQLILGKDFLPYATSGSGKGDGNTNIIFVGSGLYLPSRQINDYADVNGRGAILILDEGIPDSIRQDTTVDHRLLTKGARITLAEIQQPSAIVFLVDKVTFASPNERELVPIFDVVKSKIPSHPDSISFAVTSSLDTHQSRNIVGSLAGTSGTDSTFVLCAHYDHLGAFADSLYFPGANDNASGTAMLLALAKFFGTHPPRTSIVFLAASGEEEGLVGSRYYADHPLNDLTKTKYVLNFDVVASGDGGIMVVGGENYPGAFTNMTALADSLHIHPLWKRPSVPNSDQYSFFEKGVESFFFYTLNGTQPYHRFDDVPGTLDWTPFMHVFELSAAFIQKTDGRP